MASLVSQCRDYVGLPGKTVLLCREGEQLQSSVHHYLATCGLSVHTTFGLEETSGLLAANIPKRFCKLGTAGKQLPGLSLSLRQRKEAELEEVEGEGAGEKDCEMTVYGRNIFMGYLNREEEIKVEGEGWLELSQTASVDGEGFLRIFSSEEAERLRRVESRLRLELECVAGCLLVPLEEERTGLVLSLDCQYEEDGAPTDLLTHHCQRWFAKAGWDSVKTVGDVMTNMKEELGIRHCIQVGGRGGEGR